MPPLPPPVNFAMDDIIGNQMTLGAAASSSNPAPPYDLVLTPVGPTSMVYIGEKNSVFEPPDMLEGSHTRAYIL